METMHPTNVTRGPKLQFPVLAQPQPCMQAAAFQNGTNGTSATITTVLALLNVCNTTIPIGFGDPELWQGEAVLYPLADPGGKAPLPADPGRF